MKKQIITPTGYVKLDNKQKALYIQQQYKDKNYIGRDIGVRTAKSTLLYTGDESFNFDPDWNDKQLDQLEKQGYNPTFDNYTPTLLTNFKSPNSHDRSNQKSKRVIYLDGRTKKEVHRLRDKYSYEIEIDGDLVKKWPDYTLVADERNNYLSEMQCCLHHLNYHVSLGTERIHRASDCLALLINTVYTEKYWNNIDWYWLYDILQRRCYANNFEGDWNLISKILRLSGDKIILYKYLKSGAQGQLLNKKGNFSKAKFNELVARGYSLRKLVTYKVSLSNPVKHKKFKRGFQHTNSDKNSSSTYDQETRTLIQSEEWTYDFSNPPTAKESQTCFLRGIGKIRKMKIESEEGKYLVKRRECLIYSYPPDSAFPKLGMIEERNILKDHRTRQKKLEEVGKIKHHDRYQEYFDSVQPSEITYGQLSPQELEDVIKRAKQRRLEEKSRRQKVKNLEMEPYLTELFL